MVPRTSNSVWPMSKMPTHADTKAIEDDWIDHGTPDAIAFVEQFSRLVAQRQLRADDLAEKRIGVVDRQQVKERRFIAGHTARGCIDNI